MGELDEKLSAILGNQEAMGQIMALAKSLGGSGAARPQEEAPKDPETEAPPPPAPSPVPAPVADPLSMLGNVDPRLIQLGMRVLGEYQRGDDKKTALLNALRPFVREERYEKLDRAIQLARVSRVIRVLFDAMRGEGEGRV